MPLACVALTTTCPAALVASEPVVKTGEFEPDFHALATGSTIILPWDREVIVDGELVANPAYEEALGLL